MELKSVVYSIADELNTLHPTNVGILDASGHYIASNFTEGSHALISKIVKQYASIPINHYIKQDLPNSSYYLYIYKISTDVFIVCITDALEDLVLKKFGQITRDYGNLLLERLQPPPKKPKIPEDDRIIAIVFSKAGDLGPTAVTWMPKSLSERVIFEIAAKSLLILSAGFDGSKILKDSSSVLPFPHGMGLVYVFSIPDDQARGKAYDASISVLLKKEYRKALLERLDLFEKTAKLIAQKIQQNAKPVTLIEQFYEYVSNSLNKKVEGFTSPQTQHIIPSDYQLKRIMIQEIKRIQVEHPKSLDLDFSRKRRRK
ncbi:MAG: hypothetical protein ACFFD2_08245 [Promethearchaeota archaeon]